LQVSLADADLCSDEMIDYANLSPGPYVKLKASDSGHGMDAQTVKMVFDPYFSTKDKSKGSGLGLSIVHGIVSTCKGAVRVESQPGQGTTFQVLFPAAAVSQPGLQDLQEDKRIWGRGECFLFIDDEPMLANLGRKRLENLGYKVVAETNPIAALRRFREQPDAFSLVITDMTMPQMTGEKLAKELVAIRPDIPIIICTGYNHRIDEKTAKTIGVKAFLTKPIAIDLLAEVVNRALKGE
jgi:CheY-like chemotaxis protein